MIYHKLSWMSEVSYSFCGKKIVCSFENIEKTERFVISRC